MHSDEELDSGGCEDHISSQSHSKDALKTGYSGLLGDNCRDWIQEFHAFDEECKADGVDD